MSDENDDTDDVAATFELTSLRRDEDVSQEEYEARYKRIAEDEGVAENLIYRTEATEDALDQISGDAAPVYGTDESPAKHTSFENQRPLTTGNKMLLRGGRATTIPLYNSGFHITITAPTPMDLQGFVTSIRNTSDEFGAIYGSAYYLQQSSLIMLALVELVIPRIIDSSLDGWYKEKIILKNLSVHDYDTIIAHVTSIIFNGEYEHFRTVCSECGHVRKLTIDPRLLILRNESRLTEPQKAHMLKSAGSLVTIKEVLDYKRSLLLCDYSDSGAPVNMFTRTDDTGKYSIYLQDATMNRYRVGNTMYGERIRRIVSNVEAAGKEVGLDDIINANILAEYMPWIEKIVQESSSDDENDTLEASTPADIIEMLEVFMGYDHKKKLLTKLDTIIKDHKVTHLGYMTEVCPADDCDHIEGEHGVVTLDPNTLLFLAASSKLATLA